MEERKNADPEDRRKRLRREEDNILDDVVDELLEAKKKLQARLKTDVFRVIGGFLLMCVLFLPELLENLLIFKYVAGFLLGVAVITHITRRILFPYIDLSEYSKKALENPIASSIVFLGMCIIISVTIMASAGFFSR